MDRDKLITKLNYVAEATRYKGNLRQYDNMVKKFLMFGPIALVISSGLGIPVIGTLFVFLYNYLTDNCRKKCKLDNRCYNICYYKSVSNVIKMIRKDLKQVSKITDIDKKNKIEKKLKKELIIWQARLEVQRGKITADKKKIEFSNEN